jgi:hypothetical protein
MKKIIALSLLLMLCMYASAQPPGLGGNVPVKPGNVYNDSQALVEAIDDKNINEVLSILNYYVSISNPGIKRPDLIKVVKGNVHLKTILDSIMPLLEKFKPGVESFSGSRRKSGNTVPTGFFDEAFPATKVADGLGIFLAERFKEELTQRYLQAFRDSIAQKDSAFHYSVLLPETYKALVSYENVFDYKQFLTTLKEAFKDDLDNAGPNTLLFIDAIKHNNGNRPEADYYLTYYLADFVVNDLAKGGKPGDIFRKIEDYQYKDRLNRNVADGIMLVNIFQRNLATSQEELGPKEILNLLKNSDRLLAFVGLLMEAEKSELEALKINGKNGYQLLNDDGAKYFALFMKSIASIRKSGEIYRDGDRKFKDVVQLATAINPVVDTLLVRTNVISTTAGKKIFPVVNSVLHLSDLAAQEKYGLVIVESLDLFRALGLENTRFYAIYKKYGIFMGNVAQAENSQQVKEALDAAALPVGSYRIKRNAFVDISFNAYPGVSLGVEFRKDIPAGIEIDKRKWVAAFSAPVGIAFSLGSVRTKKNLPASAASDTRYFRKWKEGQELRGKYLSGSSHSLFVSIIDVGAITAFRLGDDNTEALPEFTWQNILAPGAFYVFGLKNTPLSLGAGVQYGPQLRKIDDTNATLDKSLLTVKAFIAVDIAIFNFYACTTR